MDSVAFGPLGLVCRLGLAAHMNSQLIEADFLLALDQGIDFFNWPGSPDPMSRTIAGLSSRRKSLKVCVQFEARTAKDAERELDSVLREMRTDFVDILTFYYVEAAAEWAEIAEPGGALEYCRKAKEQGKVRMLGLTSHQRPLGARIAASGLIDMLMMRYNAAHRGAEADVFPVTKKLGMPVVAYTSLRWGALLGPTPADPPEFAVPRAPWWYRFVLHNPAVTIALAAPHNRAELEEDLTILRDDRPLSAEEYRLMAEHGARVRKHAGQFP
jgi:predicted aldo/keto reductase-like oxidoreductase